MGAGVSNSEILQTLTRLNAGLSGPVWLFGGVAVDFLVGRWTRPHGDIDLNAYSQHREQLTRELNAIGFHTPDTGWLTHWAYREAQWQLEVAFLELGPEHSGVVVIQPGEAAGTPGRYPTLPGYLDPNRYATLEGVTFRVCSPAGEWLARTTGLEVIEGRPLDPKLQHDRRLLEEMLTEAELTALRNIAAQRAKERADARHG